MRLGKARAIIALFCCFLGAGIISFMLSQDAGPWPGDNSTHRETKRDPQGSQWNRNLATPRRREAGTTAGSDLQASSDDLKALEALCGDLVAGDMGDAMDMEWSSREITSDFSDPNKVADAIRQFPVTGDVPLSKERLDLLCKFATEMIFNNGNNDYDSYLNFLRTCGERVDPSVYDLARRSYIGSGIPQDEIPTDPWELLSQDLRDRKKVFDCSSMWKGLVSEGSSIRVFETQTSRLPLGPGLYSLRGAVTTFRDLTAPPISLDEMLEDKGKVLMADVQVFIAHDDVTGGVVWPYIIRYWFDPIDNLWRVQRAALFKNRHKAYRIYVLP